MRKTANGALTLKTSGSACLDLFSVLGAVRKHPAQAVNLFAKAFKEDQALAVRILLWARDARAGAGERRTFRNILHWLERQHPQLVAELVRSGKIQELGRWDDLLTLGSDALWPLVADQVGRALVAGDRLAAKWMPRQGPLAVRFCKHFGVSAGDWRRGLAGASETVEQLICAGRFGDVAYAAVPSVAAARYQTLFTERDGARYREYLEAVKAGTATMHAGAVHPHEIVKAAYHQNAAATVQWSQLPRPAIAGEVLVMSDVSGSMNVRISGSTTAMDVSVALGLLLSESMPKDSPFYNKVLTFTSVPHLHTVRGESLRERADCLLSADWGMSTDLQRALQLVLHTVKSTGCAMPKALVVLSDMEFDKAGKYTNHDAVAARFAAAGYAMPAIVYWNLNGRPGNTPAVGRGVALVSGYSAKIAEAVLSGDFDRLNPEFSMRAAVEVSRYDIPGVTVPKTALHCARLEDAGDDSEGGEL